MEEGKGTSAIPVIMLNNLWLQVSKGSVDFEGGLIDGHNFCLWEWLFAKMKYEEDFSQSTFLMLT